MKAVVIVPVAPVRRDKDDRSELVTQYLYGEPIEVLTSSGQWRYCRSEVDKYEGWVDEKQLSTNQFQFSLNYLIQEPVVRVEAGGRTLHIPAGGRMPGEQPSGRLGRKPEETTGIHIAQTALQFLGAPYLWGGKTVLGMDCSGLTQLACALNNIAIPRDASQQVHVGESVDFVELVATGDLAFFGNEADKITHVGIVIRTVDAADWLEGYHEHELLVLHASGEVRIDLFDHQGIFRKDSERYSHTLRVIKRVIP